MLTALSPVLTILGTLAIQPAEPVQAPAQPAPAPAQPEAAETPSPDQPKAKKDRYDRRGLTLRLGVGTAGCETEWCTDYDAGYETLPGFASHLELGYRPIEYLSVGLGADLMYLPVDYDTAAVETTDIVFAPGAFLYAHPVAKSLVDPYLGVGLGFLYNKESHEYLEAYEDGSSAHGSTSFARGFARLTAGVDFYLGKHVGLGPRFEYTQPFGGRVCFDDPVAPTQCMSVKKAFDAGDRRELLATWAFKANLSFTF